MWIPICLLLEHIAIFLVALLLYSASLAFMPTKYANLDCNDPHRHNSIDAVLIRAVEVSRRAYEMAGICKHTDLCIWKDPTSDERLALIAWFILLGWVAALVMWNELQEVYRSAPQEANEHTHMMVLEAEVARKYTLFVAGM